VAGNLFAGAQPQSITSPGRVVPHPGGVSLHYAFALYRPPSLSWGGGAGNRQVSLNAVFKPQSGPEQRAQRALALVRPPVVLVHGTYDDPDNCWSAPFKTTAGGRMPTMTERLAQEGLVITRLDWKATNGSANPSDFVTNEMTVFHNKNGIRDALTLLRNAGYAATQADLVCTARGA
jgi:hypothetical protein